MDISTIVAIVGLIAAIIIGVWQIYLAKKAIPQPSTKNDIDKTPLETHQTSRKYVISNLPARGEFVGREKEKARVLEGLKSNYPFVIIQGLAGMGKTALAREIGWVIKEKSESVSDNNQDLPIFDAIIWIENSNGNLSLVELLDIISGMVFKHSDQLQIPRRKIEVMKKLQEQACLIIIDNFDTIPDAEVRSFIINIPAPRSRGIVISKKRIVEDGWIVHLGKMTKEDSYALTKSELSRLGAKNATSLEGFSSPAMEKIYEITDGDPFTIRIKVGQIQSGIPVETVLSNTDSDDDRLEPSWAAVKNNPTTATILMTLCLFNNSVTVSDLAYVSEVQENEIIRSLKDLDLLMLVESKNDASLFSYSVHSRVKAFVKRKMNSEFQVALSLQMKVAEWAESYAAKWGGLKNWQGYSNLDNKISTILSIVEWCSHSDLIEEKKRAINIWRSIDHYMSVKGLIDEYIKLGELCLGCANFLGDVQSLTDIKVKVLGWSYLALSNYKSGDKKSLLDKAETLILDGLKFYQDLGDLEGAASAYRYLGMIAQQKNDIVSAKSFYEKSLESFEIMPGLDSLGSVLSSLGILALQQNDFETANDYQTRRLALADALKNPEGKAVALYNLGRLAHIKGEISHAIEHYNRSLQEAIYASKGDVIAASKMRIASILLIKRNIKEAAKMAESARDSYSQLGVVPEELLNLLDTIAILDKENIIKSRYATITTFFKKNLQKPTRKE